MHPLVDKVKAAGVVGAGGAGFPAHLKYDTSAEIVLANGAECEPLWGTLEEEAKEKGFTEDDIRLFVKDLNMLVTNSAE